MWMPSSHVWVSPLAECTSSVPTIARIEATAGQKRCRMVIPDPQDSNRRLRPGGFGGAGAFAQCRLLCSAKPVHSGYSCEPPCWLLLGEITPAGPYGSWVTWPVLRLGEFALSDAANH